MPFGLELSPLRRPHLLLMLAHEHLLRIIVSQQDVGYWRPTDTHILQGGVDRAGDFV